MELKNTIIVTRPYKNKSKFAFWHRLVAGDQIRISVEIKPITRNSYGTHATQVNLKHLGTGDTFTCTITELSKYLGNLEYTPLLTEEEKKQTIKDLGELLVKMDSPEYPTYHQSIEL